MNQTVAGKRLGQAAGEDRVSLFIYTKCSTVVTSLLIISCGLRGAHSHGPTSSASPASSMAQLQLQSRAFALGAGDPAINACLLPPLPSESQTWLGQQPLPAGLVPEDSRPPLCKAAGSLG